MRDLDNLKEMIAKHEGYEPRVYKCPNGYDTIGYGFAIKDLFMDEEIANLILDKKIRGILARVEGDDDWDSWFFDKPEIVQDVLVNMIFQMDSLALKNLKKQYNT